MSRLGAKEDAIDEAAAVAMGRPDEQLLSTEWCYVWFLDALNERGYDVVRKVSTKGGEAGNKERKRKRQVARTPEDVAKYKERFLKQLALGCSPGAAARVVGIARSTAYGWKKEDQEFDAAWVDAVETALDLLEAKLYDSGMAGNSSDAQFILKHRRYHRPQQSNFISQITLQEHYERLERLGLPIPVKQVPRENGQEKAATPPPVLTNTNVVPMPILGNSKEHHPLSVRRKSNK